MPTNHQPGLLRPSQALQLVLASNLRAEFTSCRITSPRLSNHHQVRRSSSSHESFYRQIDGLTRSSPTRPNQRFPTDRDIGHARSQAGGFANTKREPPYINPKPAERVYDPFAGPRRDLGKFVAPSDRRPPQRFGSRDSYASRKPLARSQAPPGPTVYYRRDKDEFPHLTLNEDINASYIQEQTLEGLRAPTLLSKRLQDIDRSRFMIQETSRSQNPEIAICKLVHKPTYRKTIERMREEEKREFEGMTIDEDIQATLARVKSEEDSFSEPIAMTALLKETNREKFIVHQLNKPDDSDTVIVKLVDKEEYRRSARERKKERKKSLEKPSLKQIEMAWTITENDLNHKFRQLEGFIEKKKKVEIMIAPKRKSRKATTEEAATLVQNIRNRLAEVNARETKTEGNLMGLMTMFVQFKPV